ncbi:MAG: type III pantothenate kinase [Methylotenera sp.]
MLLTIDAGNTRTKWALFNEAGEIKNHGASRNEALTTADFSPSSLGYERVVISNVAGERLAALLAEKFAPYALPVRWLKTTSQACGVSNGYSQTETLGSDRWAALIAAWHIKQAPCVVVNAGTAVTIDALATDAATINGMFLGGLILPGLDLMQQSLGLATAQLPKLDPNLNLCSAPQIPVEIFAKNTADAIYAGALYAILGAITQMARELHHQCKQAPYIVISGGNAPLIYKHASHDNLMSGVTKQVVIVDNLVLQGLYLLENFMQSEPQ